MSKYSHIVLGILKQLKWYLIIMQKAGLKCNFLQFIQLSKLGKIEDLINPLNKYYLSALRGWGPRFPRQWVTYVHTQLHLAAHQFNIIFRLMGGYRVVTIVFSTYSKECYNYHVQYSGFFKMNDAIYTVIEMKNRIYDTFKTQTFIFSTIFLAQFDPGMAF